jgi:NAD(P)-dependent dehydrogenase (short-subunit alcohol dehydrogenase family)
MAADSDRGRDLSGKVAIVTGGAKGIGRAIVAELAAAGAHAVIADIAGAEQAAKELAAEGLDVSGGRLDVCDEASIGELVNAAAGRHGGVDILVNNAGLFATLTPRGFEEIDAAEWRRVMDVNVLGYFLMAKAVVPQLRRRGGGAIVNIGSTSSLKGVANMLHYTSSKGAVQALTRSLASEVGRDGITVNTVAPGFTLSDGVLDNAAAVAGMRVSAPGKRVLSRDMLPQDVVGAVRFLASPAAAFITGQTLVVDGGAYYI